MRILTFQQALVEAIGEEMRRDERVFLMGQDIGVHGGPMKSTKGLWDEFGSTGRMFDAPLSESAMVGACVGAAMMGKRPIVQIMFSEFLPLILHHLAHDAANTWYYTLGKACMPLVVRMLFGTSQHRAHAHNFEVWPTHVPGLKVVMPATPCDAKGLMKSAIRDGNPVLFFEHLGLSYQPGTEVPDGEYTIPLGKAEVKREGRQVTVAASGLMVQRALNAAEALSKEGKSVEVLDLRTLAPLDEETILSSVKKTGRLVVVHEAWKIGGIGGEVVSLVAEKGFKYLKAPAVRVGALHIPLPASLPLEKMFLPDEEKIAKAVQTVLSS